MAPSAKSSPKNKTESEKEMGREGKTMILATLFARLCVYNAEARVASKLQLDKLTFLR